jgi:hypothetical protein
VPGDAIIVKLAGLAARSAVGDLLQPVGVGGQRRSNSSRSRRRTTLRQRRSTFSWADRGIR